MDLWQLPITAQIEGKTYGIHTDFRDILDIFRWFSREDIPLPVRWQIAIHLFYVNPIPREHWEQGAQFLTDFIHCGQTPPTGPKLMDWQQDADLIIADVNRAAGQEIRRLPYVHWWTFLSWFHAIGDGQLAAVVAIRQKLRSGKRLEGWEKTFYQENRHRIQLKKPLSPQQEAEKAKLEKRLK